MPNSRRLLRSLNETQLESMEEKGQHALEVAEEAHEKEKARPEDEKEVRLLNAISFHAGVWGNLVSLRAPVMGMIYVGFADR